MTAPTAVLIEEIIAATAVGSKVSSAYDVNAGDFLVCGVVDGQGDNVDYTLTGGGGTWSRTVNVPGGGGDANVELHTCPITSTQSGVQLTITRSAGTTPFLAFLARVTNHNEATFGGPTGSVTGTEDLQVVDIVTTEDDTLIIAIGGDFNALDGSGVTYLNGASALGYEKNGGAITGYLIQEVDAVAGSINVGFSGLTGERMQFAAIGIRPVPLGVAQNAPVTATAFDATVSTTDPQKVADRGSVQNTTTGTTSLVDLAAGASITVGNYLIARVACDNSGTNGVAPGLTVSDPRGNTWTVLGPALQDPGAANAGIAGYLAYCKVTNAFSNGDDVTFTWGITTPAKAIVVEEWKNIHGGTPVAVAATTANGASTSPSAARTPLLVGQLVYGMVAIEGIAGDTFTQDSDTTDGSWQSLTKLASANATATNNACIAGGYKVVSGTSAQTYNPTITSRDWAELLVVFDAARPTSAPAENAAVSAEAFDATASVGSGTNASAESAEVTATAADAQPGVAPTAEVTDVAAAAADATPAVAPSAEHAEVAAAAQDPAAAVAPAAEHAPVTATAFDATVLRQDTVTATAENAAVAAAAHDPQVAVAPTAQEATATATAFDATASGSGTTTATAEDAPVAVTAFDATVAISPTAETAEVTATAEFEVEGLSISLELTAENPIDVTVDAFDAQPAIGPGAEPATAAATAYDATALTQDVVTAPAEHAPVTAAAFDATALTENRTDALAEVAEVHATANGAVVQSGNDTVAQAEPTEVTVEAPDATVALEVPAGLAAVTATAFDPTVAVAAAPGEAQVAVTAYDATADTAADIAAEPALVTGSAFDATVSISVNAGFAAVTATAADATSTAAARRHGSRAVITRSGAPGTSGRVAGAEVITRVTQRR